ncbi:MAG: family 78 glycoside hydrolase catalytic domain [Lachnospiraceae bacterium]|nr:family 78 glycoside hydrolase catalytic domain [Lachnospiraceae bacterium]
MKESGWMTIPEWNSVKQRNIYGREQEVQAVPEKDAPENLHVLVRGTMELPTQDCELLVAADDYYQIWIDGGYRGQGPAASFADCCFYDRYPLEGCLAKEKPECFSEEIAYTEKDYTEDSHTERTYTEKNHTEEKRTVTVALHLYYHGRISRSWTSGDGRFGLWLSVCQKGKSPDDEPEKEVARCDETWRYRICTAYSGETVGYDTQFLENFDSRLWPEGWEMPDFCTDFDEEKDGFPGESERCIAEERKEKCGKCEEDSWGYLVPALWADYHMLPRPIRMLEEYDVFPVQRWEETARRAVFGKQEPALKGLLTDDEWEAGFHRLVLDFGREITGAVVAEAAGPAGTQVVIRCGEELEETSVQTHFCCEIQEKESLPGEEYEKNSEDAGVETASSEIPRVRWDMRCGCAYQEIWTLGEGVSRLHPYDYKGFRYAELLYPKTVELRQVYAWVRHYPMEEDACTLKCCQDVPEIEQIFEICKNAVRCCSQDGYLDCPTREKGQYLGDALITARSQVWLTGSTELLRKCIWDFISSETVSPSLMAVSPGSVMQEIADFSLLFPLLPLTDYEFTGDRTYLARCYPAVRALTESFLIYQRKDGLLENVSALWNLVDWPENLRDGYDFPLTRPVVGEGCHNVVNALWYGANVMQEEMEKLLEFPITGRSAQIADSFRRVFYRREQQLFADSESSGHCSLHANLYAAFFGLLPKESEEAYVCLLQTPGRVCGVLPAWFALKSLARMGRPEVCYERMMRADSYGWRNMVREGASASFEAWGKDQKWNTSLCHGWSSGFLTLFIEEIAGLHPDPGRPEGYRFEPPRIADCPEFELNVPWRGSTLRIMKEKPESCVTIR